MSQREATKVSIDLPRVVAAGSGADVAGDTFLDSGKVLVWVINSSGSARDVEIDGIADLTVNVPIGETRAFFLPRSSFTPTDGNRRLDYPSGVTSLFVQLFEVDTVTRV